MSKPSLPNRPPPPSRPGHVQVVKAIYAYSATRPDELTFGEGEMIYILDKNSGSDGWWKARVNDKTGLIPSNYVENSTENIDNPLHEAAKRGNVDFTNECLGNKVSVNGLDSSGSIPLHWAASGGHVECAIILLSAPKISINVQNKLGDTPLHNASWKGRGEIVQQLLIHGADTTIKNNEKKTALDLARTPDVQRLLVAPKKSAADDGYGGDSEEDDE